jgi:hypothetical protein
MEGIIYKYLCDCEELTGNLTSWSGIPAIFQTKAPDDTDVDWGESQYPRIIFDLDMQADPERKVSGQLMIDVMCENNSDSVQLEDLENAVKTAVDGCFFSNEEITISSQWRNCNPFMQGNDDEIIGTTLVFDVIAYPKYTTESPDPISSTNLWIKTLYPYAHVIGNDKLPETWKPLDTSPAIYCRVSNLSESKRMKSTYSVDWIGAEIHIHIMAPSDNVRASFAKQIIQLLVHATRIMLDDGSPMLIDKSNVNLSADPMRVGQVVVGTTYGVLTEKIHQKLNNIRIEGINAEREVKYGE